MDLSNHFHREGRCSRGKGDEQKSTWQGREEQGEEEILAKNKSRKGSWDH